MLAHPEATAASEVEGGHHALDASIARFAGRLGRYDARAFRRIHESSGFIPLEFNAAAAVFGPVWAATRGVWGLLRGFLIPETVALVQIGRGLWGDLGGDLARRAASQFATASGFADKAAAAKQAGSTQRRSRRWPPTRRTRQNAAARRLKLPQARRARCC